MSKAKVDYPGLLAFHCKAVGLPEPTRELKFHPKRKWRFDLAWERKVNGFGYSTTQRLAVEVDGGGFVNGRHSRGTGIEKDAEKFAEAAVLGWTVIRVTPRQVQNGKALKWIEKLLHA